MSDVVSTVLPQDRLLRLLFEAVYPDTIVDDRGLGPKSITDFEIEALKSELQELSVQEDQLTALRSRKLLTRWRLASELSLSHRVPNIDVDWFELLDVSTAQVDGLTRSMAGVDSVDPDQLRSRAAQLRADTAAESVPASVPAIRLMSELLPGYDRDVEVCVRPDGRIRMEGRVRIDQPFKDMAKLVDPRVAICEQFLQGL